MSQEIRDFRFTNSIKTPQSAEPRDELLADKHHKGMVHQYNRYNIDPAVDEAAEFLSTISRIQILLLTSAYFLWLKGRYELRLGSMR